MIVIVDTRYVLYRSHFKTGHLSYNGVYTGAMFGLMRTLKSFRRHYGDSTKFILAHDSGIPQFRLDLSNDEYKSGRTTSDPIRSAVNDQQSIIQKELPLPSWVEVQTEADDLIASFCINHDVSKEDVCIITNDKDIYSSLRDGIFIQKSVSERPFTADDLYFEYHEATSETWPLIKAIAGDKSDNLNGVPGYKEARASKTINQGMINKIMGNGEHRAIVERNLKIVTPITSYKGWPEPQPVNITDWNMFCNSYGMVLSRIDQNLSTLFQSNNQQPIANQDPNDLSFPSVLEGFIKKV